MGLERMNSLTVLRNSRSSNGATYYCYLTFLISWNSIRWG